MKADKKWYAAFVQTGDEEHVKKRLCDNLGADFRFIVPKRLLKERKSGRIREVQRTLFPGYILIEGVMDVASNIRIRNTMGLVKILENEGTLLTIHPHEIEVIRRLTADDENIGTSILIKEGEQIKVREGPLVGQEGLIVSINPRKKRAKVRLNLFGEQRIVELAIELIDANK